MSEGTVPSRIVRRRRWIAAALFAGLAVAVALAITLRDGDRAEDDAKNSKPDSPAAGAATKVPPVHRSTSPFLNTHLSVRYVGSERCRDCHEEAHRTHAASLHSRSLAPVRPQQQPGDASFVHEPSQTRFAVERRDGQLWHRAFHRDGEGSEERLAEWPVKFQVGSGHVAKSYFIEDDGFLVQSPITWYAKDNRWRMSPGYEGADHSSFKRVVFAGCLYCHTGRIESVRQPSFRHRIVEHSIGCERCHGPGQRHVERHSSGEAFDAEVDRSIVNPKHLSRELSEDVCAQCHLQGDLNLPIRGRATGDYRPGLPLKEYRLEFRKVDPRAKLKVAGHVEQLHASRCYLQSKTLTCITCHQPHEVVAPDKRIAHARETCINCHQQQPCKIAPKKREATNGNNCVQCHMPTTETNVTHVALTHHRIGIHKMPGSSPAANDGGEPPRRYDLAALQPLDHLSSADRDRAWGLAWLKLVRMTPGRPAEHPKFRDSLRLLRNAHDAGLRDAEVLAALAGIARAVNDLDRAERLADEALSRPAITVRTRFEATDILAEVHFRRRNDKQTVKFLRQAVAMHRSPLHWYLLGTIEARSGHRKAAIAAIDRAVRISPRTAQYHKALVPLLIADDQPDRAQRHRQWAARLTNRPRPAGKGNRPSDR